MTTQSIHKRPLEDYSAAVLAEWIRVRGFSYFDEELEGIERRLARPVIESQRLPLCDTCKDTQIVISDGGAGIVSWCTCEGAQKLRQAVPDFVNDLNTCRAMGVSPKSRRRAAFASAGELATALLISNEKGESL